MKKMVNQLQNKVGTRNNSRDVGEILKCIKNVWKEMSASKDSEHLHRENPIEERLDEDTKADNKRFLVP